MTIPAWPSDVPYSPLLGTLQIPRTAEPPVSTDMNSGTTRRRRKYSLRIAPVSMTLMMTNAESLALQEFHQDTLGDGASRFTMPIYFAGAFMTKTVLFAEPPSYDPFTQAYVKISISLLVEAL